jgi:peptide/nickel transport system substrate-binding protein
VVASLIRRRAFTAGVLAAFLPRASRASGRTPVGGKLTFQIPWSLQSIDPHRLDDAVAGFIGETLFDRLYVKKPDGAVTPALAESEPEPEGTTLRVRLREGLRTARGRVFDAKDAAWSIARARSLGAAGWLAEVPTPREDGNALVFPMKDATTLLRALSSPLLAMVPKDFSPFAPDGTGPMRFQRSDGGVVLSANPLAARGRSFLDEIVLRSSASVADSLLSFEAGTDDLGWLERGLHAPRPGSVAFDFGAIGWVVLSTGQEAGRWDAPGVAQSLADGIAFERLASLHLGTPWPTAPSEGWGGPAVSLLVRDDSPWLLDVANAVAATLSRPSHEVTVRAIPPTTLAARRLSRDYGLAIDVVRSVGSGALGTLASLVTFDNPARAEHVIKHPPRLGEASARTLTRMLHTGVVGELRVLGGRIPNVILTGSADGAGFDLAASYRVPSRSS